MRTYYLAGNWKMNTTPSEGVELASGIADQVKGSPHRVMIAPPFTALQAVGEALRSRGSNIRLGAQNMSSEESGAHTGEVSVLMLKALGVATVILGHSERRIIYGESNAFINAKVKLALAHGLEVILCVGETLEEREAGKAETVVKEQLEGCLSGVGKDTMQNVVIAYEPVWAIGTGKTATPEDAESIHKVVRDKIEALYTPSISEETRIQYGGSVKPDNVKGLMKMPNIDGALVGGASLKISSFVPIVQFDK